MNLLAIDTSSNACSVALRAGNNVTLNHVVKPREHTRILLPMIEELLRDAGMDLVDLDCIILGNGPGSFIGMRIAASVAQGMAFGADLRIVPVSSMAAIAAETFSIHDETHVIVAQDAHMNEVYLAAFSRGPSDLPVAERKVILHAATDIIDGVPSGDVLAAGAGWQRYPELFERNKSVLTRQADILYPNARHLLTLGQRAWDAGEAVAPHEIIPEYVRMKVAEKPASASV
jgi:tRNA threonylcarbamoyladenosine biosynthesis protein TsaB